MKALALSMLGSLCSMCVVTDDALAHGGQYRGPEDIVPPGGFGPGGRPVPGGPTSGPRGPVGPGQPGPGVPGAGPGTRGPGFGGGGGPGGGGRTGGISLSDDLAKWYYWWEFNKDPFLNLKEAIHAGVTVTGGDEIYFGPSRRNNGTDSLRPRPGDLQRVLISLKRVMDQTDNRDIVSSCLIALGKVGRDHKTFEVLPLIRTHLTSLDQEIRETAAVAMGITQMPSAIPDLIDLARDTQRGRQLCDRPAVDYRTRSFACYALGLVAHSTGDIGSKRACYEALADVLEKSTESMTDRNVPVAAINGMRLLHVDAGTEAASKLRSDCVDTLWTYYQKAAGQGEQHVQSHVPPAVAQLLGRGGDPDGKYKDVFANELAGKYGKRRNEIYQSSAIALGILCQPGERLTADAKYSDALLRYFRKGKDQQTRWFCLMSMGKIGGAKNRSELLKVFDKGIKATVKPWAAISLGVLAHNAMKTSSTGMPDETIGRALHASLTKVKNDQTQSAIAVALGLCKYRDAAGDIEELLQKYKSRDEFAGYLCIGLALMDSRESQELIHGLVKSSVRRPELLKQAAIALGKMRDKSVRITLEDMLRDPGKQNVASLSSIASALGFIGDRKSIDPLAKMLFDESITPLSRAFAAVALGGVADKEMMPWNSKIAVDMNYRAAVETLTNQTSGVLDIL